MSNTIAPVSAARLRAAARRSGPGGAPASRAYSPSCGVRMLGALRFSSNARAPSLRPSAVSASASITSGTGTAAITARISSTASSEVPRPGPSTTALHLVVASKKASAHPVAGRCMRTASMGQAAVGSPGEPRRIIPAPAAMAPRVHRMAEPSIPGEPAPTPTAWTHLFPSRARRGRSAAMSASSITMACGALGNPMPMSATSTRPQSAGPPPWSRPGLAAANVTVRSARTAPGPDSPGVGVDPRRDVDGQHAGPHRHVGRLVGSPEPRPVGPVDNQVTVGQARGGSDASTTLTRAPRPANTRAATRPSAPFEPLPATTTTRRP